MNHPFVVRSALRAWQGSRLPRVLAGLVLSTLLATTSPAAGSRSSSETKGPEIPPACTADYPYRDLVAGLQPTTAHRCDDHDLPCWQAGFAELIAALEENPDDLNLGLTYHQLHENWPGPDRPRIEKLRRETADALAERPDEPRVRYLHARALPSAEGGEGIRRAASELPAEPWPLLDLAYLEAVSGEHQDPASADPHLERFLELCPAPPAWALAYGHVGLGSAELWRRHLPRLRTMVEAMPPFERLAGFYHLWAIEGRALPLEVQESRRLQPLDDLETLESQGLEDTVAYWLRWQEAHQRAGDEASRLAASAQLAERFPCRKLGNSARNTRWDQDHEGVLQAVGRALLTNNPVPASTELYAAAGRWSTACGDGPKGDLAAAQLRFAAGLGLLQATRGTDDPVPSPEALWADAERWIALWEARREVDDRLRSPYPTIARYLLDHGPRGLEPDRAVALLDQHAEYRAWVRENSLDDDHLAQVFADQRRMGELNQALDHNLDLLRALTAANRWARAMATVEESIRMLTDLETLADGDGPSSTRARQLAHRLEVRLWTGRATLATALDRPLDALAFNLRAEALTESETTGTPPSLDAWRDLGGSEQGWRALVGTVAAQSTVTDAGELKGWETLDRPLDDFDLEDITGDRWRRADLAGQTVLFNVWATWCAPCLEELPLVQRLYERFADSPEVKVVSLNIDHEIGRVKPFLEREGYTFPTLLGDGYFQRLLPTSELSVPQTWLVDGGHVLRQRQRGFEMGSAEGLETEIVERLQAMVAEAMAEED